MTTSDRIYQALLRLYPEPFREAFGGPMAQLFRDQHRDASARGLAALAALWLHTLADVAITAAQEHLERIVTMRRTALFISAAALGLAIGWVDIHNDEVWAALLLLLSMAFLLGFTEPRQAWRWGLLIAGGMFAIHAGAALVGFAPPCHPGEVCPPPGLRLDELIILVPALFGTYCGVGVRALSKVEQGDLVWWVGAALVGLAVGLLGQRTRAVGNSMLVVGLLAVMAGFTRPAQVWRWALALGVTGALTHGWGELTGDLPNLALKILVADLLPAFIGAYVGFGLRWLIDRYLPERVAPAETTAG